jgi:hypothetical protein
VDDEEDDAVTGLVGVLCVRQRVEEKQIIAALAEAGVVGLPVPPAAKPSPLGPSPLRPLASAMASGEAATVVIDRIQDRVTGMAALAVARSGSAPVLAAGVAAAGNRVHIATTLAGAGIARPESYLVFDEGSGIAAAELVGYPATLLPLTPNTSGLTIWDRDTAEAVFEHRDMLGGAHDSIGVLQAGTPASTATLTVVDGRAVAADGDPLLATPCAQKLAAEAAHALQADIVGIVIASTASGLVVWDVTPTPDFRTATSLDGSTAAQAIAALAIRVAAGDAGSAWRAGHDVVALG